MEKGWENCEEEGELAFTMSVCSVFIGVAGGDQKCNNLEYWLEIVNYTKIVFSFLFQFLVDVSLLITTNSYFQTYLNKIVKKKRVYL